MSIFEIEQTINFALKRQKAGARSVPPLDRHFVQMHQTATAVHKTIKAIASTRTLRPSFVPSESLGDAVMILICDFDIFKTPI